MRKRLSAFVLFSMVLGFMMSAAYATVTVTPMTILIEGRDRYADVNLINTTDKTESYEIGWRFFRMTGTDGIYETSETSITDFDLTQHIIFTPRKVTLEPKSTQKVRLALRLNGEPPPPGDYRGHLEFTQVKAAPAAKKSSSAPTDKPKQKMQVGMNVAFSIPVVYRVGESDTTAVMGNISTAINEKTRKIEVTVPVTRTGQYGILGQLRVYYTPSGGGEFLAGEIRNANIFPEVNERNFKVILSADTLSGGTLRVVYKNLDRKNEIIFAEKTVPIAK